jgi:hypothetical protein
MKIFLFCVLVAILSSIFVTGLGIIPGYIENKTISVSPGEKSYYYVDLENYKGKETDVRFYLKSDVAVIADRQENYTLAANTSIRVRINITVSPNAIIGSTYPVFYYLEERFNDSVNLSNVSTTTISGKFYVEVREKETDTPVEKPVAEEETVEEFSIWDIIDEDRVAAIWFNLVIGVIVVTAVLIGVEVYYRKHSKKIAPEKKIKKEEKKLFERKVEIKKEEKELEIPPEKYFRVCNGMVFKSIDEFKKNLFNIDDLSFDYHVNSKKNDFANWIGDVFQEKELADKLRRVYTKEAFGEILKEY